MTVFRRAQNSPAEHTAAHRHPSLVLNVSLIHTCKAPDLDTHLNTLCPYPTEPTNHLDIPSKEMLEEAIQDFEGSVIAVSHDRYFLRKIATRILQVGVNPIVTPAKAVDRRPELL